MGNEKKRAINKEYGLTGMADVERSTEELPGTMNKTDDNTEKNFVSAGDDVHRSVRLRTGNG